MSHRLASVSSQAKRSSWRCAALAFALAVTGSVATFSPAKAQGIDSGTIGQLLGEIDRFRSLRTDLPQRTSRGSSTTSQGDRGAGATYDPNRLGDSSQSQQDERPKLTADDLEMLRKACRQPYDRPLSDSDLGIEFNFSRIEEDYCRRTGEVMFQFGYDMFRASGPLPDLAVGAVSADYLLGVGDEITVLLSGQEPANYNLVIDREGRLLIPGWPPIQAAGRSFGELRRELQARTAATRIGTEVYVSLLAIRAVGVYVLGEVERPGRQQLTALSSLIDAITAAGGVKKTGSLRRIHVQRGDTIFWFDAYELLLSGMATHDLALRDGDRIVVPPVGPTVAIGGEVKRPGVYELAEGQRSVRLRDALQLAGGPLRPRGNRMLQVRFDDSGAEHLVRQPDLSQPLGDGEILLVARQQDIRKGVVEVAGHVRVPGQRALVQANTLSRLVGDPNLFREDPYLLFAALETTDPQTRSRRLFPVNLHAVLEGRQDFTLRDGDRLIVLGSNDVAYLSSRDVVRTVATGGQPELEAQREREKQQQQQQQLPSTLPSTGSSVLSVDDLATQQLLQQQRSALESRGTQQPSASLGTASIKGGKILTTDPVTGEERELSDVLAKIIPCRGLEVLGSIAATTSPDRFRGVVRTIDPQDTIGGIARIRCPKIYDTYPDLLPLAVEHVIAVTGSVRRPGGYPVTPNTAVTAVIAVAGGLARDVDLTRVEISHVVPDALKGSAADSRDLVDLATNGADQVFVGPGDVLRFHAVFTDRDKGPVVLEGEVVRPGVYDIRRGERLSTLLQRAGGLTEQAYPYGAVFTRERVKEAQERDFKRAARELNSALALAASRGDIQVGALANLQLISAQLGSVEALGRVVTEADPSVLQVRPEFDVVLEPGDRLFVPKRPSFVTVVGDVLNPGALQFISGTGADDYIRQAGGFQASADESKVFVVYPNGVAEPLSVSVWNYNPTQIPPGSSIVVPKDPAPFDVFQFLRQGASLVSQLAVTAASLAVISRR